MNKQEALKIQTQVLKALQPLETELGVKFSFNGGTLSSTSASLKLVVAKVISGQVMDEHRTNFAFASHYGITTDMLDRVFTSGGAQFRLSGYNISARTRPFHAVKLHDQKVYTFTIESIQKAMGVKAD